MQLHEFYVRTLPDSNHYCLFRSSTRTHVWVESLEDLVARTEQASGTDVYFAVASFKEPGQRTQDNVEFLKCFRLDLDAGASKLAKHGEDKVYPTQQDAITSVVQFSKDTGLVPSIIVSSGEGLHVYYELDEPVTPQQWRPVAQQFQKFGTAHGLKIDSAVTADHARVLRPIGTQHPNGKRVSVLKATPKVYSLEEFAEAVDATFELAQTKYDLSVNEEVTAVQGPPKSIKKVVQKCGAMRFAFVDQAHVEEPYWRAVISICKHTVEGREAAHAMSCRHPEYSKRRTDEKFDRYEAGPALCDQFAQHNPSACGGCKYRGQIKSPILLGEMTTVEVETLPEDKRPADPEPPTPKGDPWDGLIPAGFDIVERKGRRTLVQHLEIEKENEDGDMVPYRVVVPLTTDIFWLGRWSDAEDSGDTAQIMLHKLEAGRIKSYTMDQSLVASRSDLLKFLAGKSIHTSADKRAGAGIEAYMKTLLQKAKEQIHRPKIFDRFGLRVDPSGLLTCAHGAHLIYPNGRIEEALIGDSLVGQVDSYSIPLPEGHDAWEPSVWASHIMPRARRYVDFVRKSYGRKGFEKFQLAMMFSLASPLLSFATGEFKGTKLPATGLTVSLYSRSGGKGKTTLMRLASTAYGNPNAATRVRNALGATSLARQAVLTAAGTMPVMMDEMGGGEHASTETASLVSNVANGGSRERVRRDGSIIAGSTWSLICTLSTNVSHRDLIALAQKESDAIQYRLLELNVDDVPSFSREERIAFETEFREIMRDCSGALGALIHLMICNAGTKKMNDLVQEKVAQADELANAQQAGRFLYKAFGAVMALHEMLDKRGLAPFSLDDLIRTFRRSNAEMDQYIKDNVMTGSGLELLARALYDLQPYTVVTESETRRARYVPVYDEILNKRLPIEIKARHVISTGFTYVAVDALKEWCRKNRVREQEMLVPARKTGVLHRLSVVTNDNGDYTRWAERFNLLKGTRESTNTYVRVYLVNTHVLAQHTGVSFDRAALDVISGKDNVVSLTGDAAA